MMGDIYCHVLRADVCFEPHETDSAIFFNVARQCIDYLILLCKQPEKTTVCVIYCNLWNSETNWNRKYSRTSQMSGSIRFTGRTCSTPNKLKLQHFIRGYSAAQLVKLTKHFFAISKRSYFKQL